MALIKSVNLKSGFVAEFYRIRHIIIDYRGMFLLLDLYKDEAAFLAGNSPIESNEYFLEGELNPFPLNDADMNVNNTLTKKAYKALKDLPELTGAIEK
jgi:hypothetical protein